MLEKINICLSCFLIGLALFLSAQYSSLSNKIDYLYNQYEEGAETIVIERITEKENDVTEEKIYTTIMENIKVIDKADIIRISGTSIPDVLICQNENGKLLYVEVLKPNMVGLIPTQTSLNLYLDNKNRVIDFKILE